MGVRSQQCNCCNCLEFGEASRGDPTVTEFSLKSFQFAVCTVYGAHFELCTMCSEDGKIPTKKRKLELKLYILLLVLDCSTFIFGLPSSNTQTPCILKFVIKFVAVTSVEREWLMKLAGLSFQICSLTVFTMATFNLHHTTEYKNHHRSRALLHFLMCALLDCYNMYCAPLDFYVYCAIL